MTVHTFKGLPIKWKLTVVMVLTSGLSLLMSGTALLTYEFLESRRELRGELSTTAAMIASHSTAALTFQDQEAGQQILTALKSDQRLVAATLYDRSGHIFASFGALPAGSRNPRSVNTETVTFASGHVDLFHSITFNGEALGTLQLRASTKSIDTKLERFILICSSVLVSALAIAFFLSSGLRRLISDPVLHLAKTAKAISGGSSYCVRAEKHADDEVGSLIDAFNEMLQQIQCRDTELRKHRDHLEEEVNKRTADLRLVNQELTVAKEKAEEVARLKSEFLANMSHEIRTPMNGVLGMIELALDTPEDAERRDYLETAHGSAKGLLQIINDILDFSKMDAGKLAIEAVNFNVHAAAYEIMRMLAVSAHQKGIEFLCDIEPAVPEYVIGDALRLRQILVNILGNAIKFTQSGEVMLHIQNVSPSEDDDKLHFTITDTGIGIPKDRRESIFEPFVQVDGSSTRRFGGTGLGLAICAKLVKAMNGEIWVEDGPDKKGSAFHFTIRFSKAARQQISAPVPECNDLDGLTALVIDDNQSNCRVLEKMLRCWGIDSTTASSAESGLTQIVRRSKNGWPFSVVLVNAFLPDTNGFTFVKAFGTNPLLAGPPILMLKSTDLNDGTFLELKPQLAAYLIKPVSPTALNRAIRQALGAVKPEVSSAVTALPRLTGKPLHILIADDSPVNRTVLTTFLKRDGHIVSEVSNGAEAVSFVSHEHCDLVFMDVQMPVMDGYDATRAIRSKEQQCGKHIPIIAFTAHAMTGDREKCLAVGMDDYLSKPVTAKNVRMLLQRFCHMHATDLRNESIDVTS